MKTLKPIEKDTDPEIQRLVRCSQRAVQKQRQVEAKMVSCRSREQSELNLPPPQAEGLRDPDLQAYDAVKQGVWWRQRRSVSVVDIESTYMMCNVVGDRGSLRGRSHLVAAEQARRSWCPSSWASIINDGGYKSAFFPQTLLMPPTASGDE